MKAWILALALAPQAAAHVAMQYLTNQVGPIRNAGSPAGNGRASVAGPCGGQNTWGSNGNGAIQDGDTVTLNMNYAAGHNSAANRFRMAYACGTTTQNAVGATSAQLSQTTHSCTSLTAGQPSTYDIGDGGVNAANAIVTGGYQITCTMPNQGLAVGQTEQCTIAIIDQRDWGGCVDVLVSSAAAPVPPAPPPAPLQTNQGSYSLTVSDTVDSSGPTFTCCSLVGTLTVPSYPLGATTLNAQLDSVATGCRTTADTAAPTTATYTALNSISMIKSTASGNKYGGSTSIAGQAFTFEVDDRTVQFYNVPVGDEQPIVCDGQTQQLSLDLGGLGVGGNDDGGSGGGASGGAVAGAVIGSIAGVVIIGGGLLWLYRSGGGGTPTKGVNTGTNMASMYPPPPPPPAALVSGLPPGWQAAKDPASGQLYYVNTATGQSQWEAPAAPPPPPPPMEIKGPPPTQPNYA